MHVVFPIMRLSRSGGVRVLVELANGLVRRGHRVSMLSASAYKDRTFPFPLESGIHVTRATTRRSVLGTLWWFIRNTPRDADAVVANFYLTAYPTAIATSVYHQKGYYLIQDYEPDFFVADPHKEAPPVQRMLARISYHLPLCQITISTWLQGVLRKVTGRHATVINDGVNPTVFCPHHTAKAARGDRTVMSLGRKAPRKGLADLLEAVRIVGKQVPDLRLMVATQDTGLVIDAPVPTELVYPADDQELARCYNRADVFAFPSLQEGFGLPPLEAMACGTPVVTTDCGGVLDFAEDEVNCLIVPVNDPPAMAEAIRTILEDERLAQQLARSGRETAGRFTWEATVDKFESLLGEISA